MPLYECDKCGACCSMLIHLYPVDLLREPRLVEHSAPFREPSDEGEVAMMWSSPCELLDDDGNCTIYPTRPSECVVFEAGGDDCQRMREEAGLEPLQPLSASVDQTGETEA